MFWLKDTIRKKTCALNDFRRRNLEPCKVVLTVAQLYETSRNIAMPSGIRSIGPNCR